MSIRALVELLISRTQRCTVKRCQHVYVPRVRGCNVTPRRNRSLGGGYDPIVRGLLFRFNCGNFADIIVREETPTSNGTAGHASKQWGKSGWASCERSIFNAAILFRSFCESILCSRLRKRLNYLSGRKKKTTYSSRYVLDKAVVKVQNITAARKSRFKSNSLDKLKSICPTLVQYQIYYRKTLGKKKNC